MKRIAGWLKSVFGLGALAALTMLLIALLSQATNPAQTPAQGGESVSPIQTPLPTATSETVIVSITTTPGHKIVRVLTTPWPTRTPWPTPTRPPGPTPTAVPLPTPAPGLAGLIFYRPYTTSRVEGFPIRAIEIDERGELVGQVDLRWDQNVRMRTYFDRMIPSPDGRYLAGISSEESGEIVFIVELATGKFTLPAPGHVEVPGSMYGWHPNSKEILFRTTYTLEEGLWLVDVHTGWHRLVAQPKPPDGICGAAISPDGRWLAYGYTPGATSSPSPYAGVWLAESDGRNAQRLAQRSAYVFSWSPDNRYFIYIGGRKGTHKDAPGNHTRGTLFSLMDARSGGSRLLPVSFAFGYGHYPTWSPDGRSIAYVGFDLPPDAASTSADDPTQIFDGVGVYVVDVDSGDIRRLASGIDPAWSPDGSMIAFSSLINGQADIWLINADGTALRRVTDTPEIDWRPVWIGG